MNCKQAAILCVKLAGLDRDNKLRQQIAKRYISEIKNEKIILPRISNIEEHVFHMFVIRSKQREELRRYLLDNGIQTQVHYPTPPHKQRAYKEWNSMSFPITEQIHEQCISIPLYTGIREDEINEIIGVLNNW